MNGFTSRWASGRAAHTPNLLHATAALAGWLLSVMAATAGEPEPLARYTFDQTSGEVLQDHSGNGYSGTLHNARWLAPPERHGLAFQDTASYVDCGLELARKLTGDMTIVAWVKLKAAPYPDNSTNWTLVDCEEYTRSGFVLRIDGQSTKLYYRASSAGRVPESFSMATLQNDVCHFIAVSRRERRVTLFVDGLPEVPFDADFPGQPSAPLRISSPGQPFRGRIHELTIYGCGLSKEEVLAQYKKDAAKYGKDTSWFGTLELEPFLYLDGAQATVAVNFLGVLPLPAGTKAFVELGQPDQPARQAVEVSALAESAKQDFNFTLAGLPAGRYEIRAVLREEGGKTLARQAVGFEYPPTAVAVPSPAERTVPPLSGPPRPAPPQIHVGSDGELVVEAHGRNLPVTAEFSYPGGGFNALGRPCESQGPVEATWKPNAKQLGPSAWQVTADGPHYALLRRIEVQPGRVLVRDTITNKMSEPIGILVRNHLAMPADMPFDLHMGGYRSGKGQTAKAIKTNPTIFVSHEDMGIGLAALDDVFVVQSLATIQNGRVTLHSDSFALDQHASYTLEWAVYVTASGDYYDFVNQLRRDEGRNGTVDGTVGFVTRGPADRRSVPDADSVKLRNLKYLLIHCLSFAADDPAVSIEGIEFLEYPKERQLLKAQFAAIHKDFPGMKIAFHIAHSLYATNQPEKTFADSRVIDAGGRHAVYTTSPGSYFSKERLEQGWNWYIYYPTLENSFGRAMLQSVDVMIDEIGADGPFLDGFMWAYGGEYTYDRWDGHTTEIDPKTKTIVRKMGSVLLLSQDVLVAYCRKVRDKGGVIVANNSIMTRTIAGEDYILHDRECYAGPEVHLSPTPMALSLPSAIRSEPDVYRDVLDKLRWGNLYVYYEEGRLTHSSVPAQMFPITIEEIHSGYVKGRQRLVTMNPGIYGWPGDKELHFVYLYDGRGVSVPHGFVTTADARGVRTEIALARQQCAVVKKIPVKVEANGPVNVRVDRYDDHEVEFRAHAPAAVALTVHSGEFPIQPATEYVITVNGHRQAVMADAKGGLRSDLELRGSAKVVISRANDRGRPAGVPESRSP